METYVEIHCASWQRMSEQHDEENKGNVDSTGTLRLVPAFGDDGNLPAAGPPVPQAEIQHPSIEQTVLLSASHSAQLSAAASTPPTANQPAPTGNRFHRLRPWREGGLGKVWIALDRELHREVALKEIKSQHAGNRTSQERFLIEGEITGSLEHPSIVPVYGMGRYSDGRPYYAMRFVHGESLEEAIHRFHHSSEHLSDQQLAPTANNPNRIETDAASFQLAAGLVEGREARDGKPAKESRQPSPRADAGQRAVAFRELLGHFIAVCNAIAYAHSRGVLHRDLKPANILLAKYGETLVVDWGLAKVAGQKDQFDLGSGETPLELQSGNSSAPTRLGAVVGTPAFMSPEQAQGRQDLLTSASDIYSLGATLYCLLTGRSPFEGTELSVVLDRVRTGQFPRPRQIKPDVPRALESICMKSMALTREERYATATALADDLQHWLADEPVSAHPENRWERASRWVRRHKAAAVSSAAGLLLLAIVSTVGAVLVNHQRQIADRLADENGRLATEERAAKVQAELAFRDARDAVDDFFTEVSENSLLNQPGMQPVRKELLQKTLDYYQRFLTERAGDPGVREELAATLYKAARIIDELESPEASLADLQKARDMQTKLLNESPQDAKRLKALADTENALGRGLHRSKKFEPALVEYQTGRDLREKLVALDPNNEENQRALANSIMNVGLLEEELGHLDSAANQLRAAQQLRKSQLAAGSSFKLQRDLAMGYYNQGIIEIDRGKPAEAADYFESADEQFANLQTQSPHDMTIQFYLATSYRKAADAFLEDKAIEKADRLYQLARDQFSQLAVRNPDVSEYQAALASIYMNIGGREEGEAAIADLEKSKSILNDLVRQFPQTAQFRRDLGVALRDLGTVQCNSNKAELGRQNLHDAVILFEKLHEEFPTNQDFDDQLQKSREIWNRATAPAPTGNAEWRLPQSQSLV